jgi:hypothetical protein
VSGSMQEAAAAAAAAAAPAHMCAHVARGH